MSKPLVRSTTDKYLAGVGGGIAAYLNVDANIVRVGLVLLTLFTMPVGWLVYPLLWLLMPTDAGGPSGFDHLKKSFTNGTERR